MPSNGNYVDFRAVKAAVTMEQALEHYGLIQKLHRNGDSLSGACPIHGGDSPSAFRVSLSKNCWNCFSKCQSGGNVLDFVARMEKTSLPKAARLLVDWFHLQIASTEEAPRPAARSRVEQPPAVQTKTESQRTEAPSKPAAPAVTEDSNEPNKPLEFELKHLQTDHPYLKERGLSPEVVQTFGLGLCSKGLMKDRIVIPIHNEAGKLVAYAGRHPNPTDTDKYRFPNGFKKGQELFNLHRAIQEPSGAPLFIVEGFFDCMNLWQHGARNVVAIMGSSMSQTQEVLIRQHTNRHSQVIVMLDEDEAGKKGREDIARRLARFLFVKIHVFDKAALQPDQLTAEEVAALLN